MKLDFEKTGLVLEGGGMRGVFTCGVLDFMMDHKLEFPYVIGVSAGACNGLSYMSHQRGRAKFSNIDMMDKYHYIGLKYLWYQHSILDQHLLYDLFPSQILPFDYEAYFDNPARFEIVTTNCVTGRACYLEEKKDGTGNVWLILPRLPAVCLTFVLLHTWMDVRCWMEGLWIPFRFCVRYRKDMNRMSWS